jgi:ABC-type nitrate/sulfonate/bicarbonate transport system substrate-binding protein
LHSFVDAADRVRIAVSNPNMPNHTVTVAQKKGFFKDENIDAEIIRMNPKSPLRRSPRASAPAASSTRETNH